MDTPDISHITEITPSADVTRARHGWRAKCLQRLIRMDLPVPRSFAIPCEAVNAIATGLTLPKPGLRGIFEGGSGLVSVRPSAVMPEWGGPGTVLNVGINDALHDDLTRRIGRENADAIYLSFVQSYAINIARLDPDAFAQEGADALPRALAAFEDETDSPFPQDPTSQLSAVLQSMARAWDGPTARLLRQAKGAPADAPLGLVIQEMALSIGPGLCGSGTIQFVDLVPGGPRVTGRFRGQRHG
ncbi:MAG: pyruvate, phosphate dikinase, partial [Paracoccus sp. (in: a-proteobacteria)]|nr:pyruvate, phosphate dikinase [Paracoccus sp. (in: a-proteobacteria)]